MIPPQIPPNEKERLAALDRLNLLHTEYERRFDRITKMASRVFKVPIALITLVSKDEQWFKSCVGLDVKSTSREVSFCGHAILRPDIMVVEDATKDERFHDNPLVVGPPFIRFYAGRPLASIEGQLVGTLCIIDTKTRKLTTEESADLDDLATWVEREINQFGREEKLIT